MRILIVDDDPKYRTFVSRGLGECGHECSIAEDGETALSLLRHRSFDLVLLDVMLPGLQGWDVMDALALESIRVPVLWVTARDDVEDRVRGLRMGGDDYIVKPFAFQELVARIEVCARRHRADSIHVGDVLINPLLSQAHRAGDPLFLTRSEMQLLLALAEAKGAPVSRETLLEKVWHLTTDPGTNVVEVLVRRLRKKVDEPYAQPLIHTVRGEGYALADRSNPIPDPTQEPMPEPTRKPTQEPDQRGTP